MPEQNYNITPLITTSSICIVQKFLTLIFSKYIPSNEFTVVGGKRYFII